MSFASTSLWAIDSISYFYLALLNNSIQTLQLLKCNSSIHSTIWRTSFLIYAILRVKELFALSLQYCSLQLLYYLLFIAFWGNLTHKWCICNAFAETLKSFVYKVQCLIDNHVCYFDMQKNTFFSNAELNLSVMYFSEVHFVYVFRY